MDFKEFERGLPGSISNNCTWPSTLAAKAELEVPKSMPNVGDIRFPGSIPGKPGSLRLKKTNRYIYRILA
jgi:hypothetical protein